MPLLPDPHEQKFDESGVLVQSWAMPGDVWIAIEYGSPKGDAHNWTKSLQFPEVSNPRTTLQKINRRSGTFDPNGEYPRREQLNGMSTHKDINLGAWHNVHALAWVKQWIPEVGFEHGQTSPYSGLDEEYEDELGVRRIRITDGEPDMVDARGGLDADPAKGERKIFRVQHTAAQEMAAVVYRYRNEVVADIAAQIFMVWGASGKNAYSIKQLSEMGKAPAYHVYDPAATAPGELPKTREEWAAMVFQEAVAYAKHSLDDYPEFWHNKPDETALARHEGVMCTNLMIVGYIAAQILYDVSGKLNAPGGMEDSSADAKEAIYREAAEQLQATLRTRARGWSPRTLEHEFLTAHYKDPETGEERLMWEPLGRVEITTARYKEGPHPHAPTIGISEATETEFHPEELDEKPDVAGDFYRRELAAYENQEVSGVDNKIGIDASDTTPGPNSRIPTPAASVGNGSQGSRRASPGPSSGNA
jgi:hypothetical protein